MALTEVDAARLNDNIFNTVGPFSNRIINGDMRIDQRNAGASVTATGSVGYTLDRWAVLYSQNSKFSVQRNAGSVTPPAGFTNYLGVTSLSAYSITSTDYNFITQRIEGYNSADLAWGTANAQSATLSFWVRSSLTGNFSGSLRNANSSRSYVFTYTINSANTWEYKTIVMPGETTGTWQTTDQAGIALTFCIGSGSTRLGTAGSWQNVDLDGATGTTSVVATNGATFYITGVQLEAGSVATPFERRSYGQELSLCQRYYEKSFAQGTVPVDNGGYQGASLVAGSSSGSSIAGNVVWKVTKRAAPSVTFYRPDSGTGGLFDNGGSPLTNGLTDSGMYAYTLTTTNSRAQINWAVSAEL
jgi:hypothetical protein